MSGLAVALILSLASCSRASSQLSTGCRAGVSAPCPDQDPFYDASAKALKTRPHGAVLKQRSVFVAVSQVSSLAQASLVLYASTDRQGHPIAASTVVLTPKQPYAGQGSRPILSYQLAYDSLGTGCEPSYTLQHSSNPGLVNSPVLVAALQQGWTVVVPDYEGPQALFAIGPQEGRAVLDGILAAENAGSGGVDRSSPVMMWGYSGGALGSAWASEMQPTYAPKLNVVAVAEGGVPADVKSTIEEVDGGQYSYLGPLVLVAVARAYPNAGIIEALNDKGKQVFKSLQQACPMDPASTQLANHSLREYTKQPGLLNTPKVAAVFRQLRLGQAAPHSPVYNYEAVHDGVVPFSSNQTLVHYYCSKGVVVDHVVSDTGDHVSVGADYAASVLEWLVTRVEGVPSPNTCPK